MHLIRGMPEPKGELLAATPEAVSVANQGGMEVVPVREIETVLVRVAEDRSGELAVWTLLGTVPAVLFFYVWVPVGFSAASSAEAQGWAVGAPDAAILSQYARFPQGLPPGWPPDPAAVRPCSYASRQ